MFQFNLLLVLTAQCVCMNTILEEIMSIIIVNNYFTHSMCASQELKILSHFGAFEKLNMKLMIYFPNSLLLISNVVACYEPIDCLLIVILESKRRRNEYQ
jgi:hypothetical protein